MKKVFILVYLFFFMILQSSDKDKDEIYNEIKSNAEKSKEGEISSILKKSGVKDCIERIVILEKYKDMAWEDNEPKFRDRLHAEVLYEKQDPWYEKIKIKNPIVIGFGLVICLSLLYKK